MIRKFFSALMLCFAALSSFAFDSSFPSIMVVPFKYGTETYADVLSNDFDRRMAVDKVNEGLQVKGISPIDLFATIQATLKAGEYEDGVTVDSRDKQLLDQSGADVYITVDLQKKSAINGNSVSMSLKAYNRSTGSVLASKVGFTPPFRSTAYDKMCVGAVRQIMESGFLEDIENAFKATESSGSSIMLRIALGETSDGAMPTVINLMQHRTPKGRLSDQIRNWLRVNTVDAAFHPKGSTPELIVYDNVQMPPMTADGYKLYTDEYASNFVSFLYDLGVTAEERIDGQTIYITIY